MTSKGLKYMTEMFSMLYIDFAKFANLSNSVSLKNKMSLLFPEKLALQIFFQNNFLPRLNGI